MDAEHEVFTDEEEEHLIVSVDLEDAEDVDRQCRTEDRRGEPYEAHIGEDAYYAHHGKYLLPRANVLSTRVARPLRIAQQLVRVSSDLSHERKVAHDGRDGEGGRKERHVPVGCGRAMVSTCMRQRAQRKSHTQAAS